MEVRFYRAVRCAGDWELNLVGQRLNIRIARSQFAIWLNYRPLVDWHYGFFNIGGSKTDSPSQ